jgi:hypothetical protein
MKRILSHSTRRKVMALLIAMVGFVLLYETRILDSQYEALQGLFFSGGDQPLPGRRTARGRRQRQASPRARV